MGNMGGTLVKGCCAANPIQDHSYEEESHVAICRNKRGVTLSSVEPTAGEAEAVRVDMDGITVQQATVAGTTSKNVRKRKVEETTQSKQQHQRPKYERIYQLSFASPQTNIGRLTKSFGSGSRSGDPITEEELQRKLWEVEENLNRAQEDQTQLT